MLNNVESLKYIKGLLDESEVYSYKDIVETETLTDPETGEETIVETIIATIQEQFEEDIELCANDAFTAEINTVISIDDYNIIKAKDYSEYTQNEKKLFLCEAYLTASIFLTKYALRYETEMYKTTVDFNNKNIQSEKSGKLYTADKYYATAISYLNKIENFNPVNPGKRQIFISRY